MARVPYVAKEDLPEDQRHIYDEIAGSRGKVVIGHGFRALLNSPEAAARVGALGAYLRFQSDIQAKIRELVILIVARELDCAYEWTHHQPLALKAGLPEVAIAAIREGKTLDGLLLDEAEIARYVQQLLHDHSVKDDTFNAVLNQLGTKNLVDLTLIVGYYSMLALAFRTLGVELD